MKFDGRRIDKFRFHFRHHLCQTPLEELLILPRAAFFFEALYTPCPRLAPSLMFLMWRFAIY